MATRNNIFTEEKWLKRPQNGSNITGTEKANRIGRNAEQAQKQWYLLADYNPLEYGEWNYGGGLCYKPPVIIQRGQFSQAKVMTSADDEKNLKQMQKDYSLITAYWIRNTNLFDQQQVQFSENITDLVIKYALFILLTWHQASVEEGDGWNDGSIKIDNKSPNKISINNDGINIALMNYVYDWNDLYIKKKQERFCVELKLTEFNNPIAFGFGFIVINHEGLTPYISNWNNFMDTKQTNFGFGAFFRKMDNLIDENGKKMDIDDCYSMIAFCEQNLYRNNFPCLQKWLNDDGDRPIMGQLKTGDEIKIEMNHKTEVCTLFINDHEIGDLFFTAPPYIAPAIHYFGKDFKCKCVFECEFG